MQSAATITLPRGKPGLPPLVINLTQVYEAEGRLSETKSVTPLTASELRGYYNEICNLTTKYIAWVNYEILEAERELQLAKAEVILDKVPGEVAKLKEAGIKDNADFRDALVIRDKGYQDSLNKLNTLKAVKELLTSKSKTFERAYWDCRDTASQKERLAATQNLNMGSNHTETPGSNFMGSFIGKTNFNNQG